MGILLAASGVSSLIAFLVLAVIALLVWGAQKYRERQAEQRSEDFRKLYASVHSENRPEPRRKAS
jgi:hypothetical protein